MDQQIKYMLNQAKEMSQKNNCCKHSNFSVGAALQTKDGKIYSGFNIENEGIISICAERVAFCKALTDGQNEFASILVLGKYQKDQLYKKITPCGCCRQFMKEYTNNDFIIYTYDEENETIDEYKITELLPESFEKKEEE